MRVTVQSVNVPRMSTIGYGVGVDEEGNTVHFAGDHHPMRDLITEMQVGDIFEEGAVEVNLEDWQILAVIPATIDHDIQEEVFDAEAEEDPALD